MSRPNVLVILTDDQGPWAMGCAGNGEIRTPNLDRLAASGLRFGNFFCTSPVCSPARASLLTGRIPSQHGVHDWIRDGNGGRQKAVEYLAGLTAYTDVLAAHGYACALSGKWHLGDSVRPQHGFVRWYAHQFGGGPYHNAPMVRQGELVNEPGYVTDVITDEALRFLDELAVGRQPFYLSIHYTAPHSPWVNSHPQAVVDSYADCPFASVPDVPDHPWRVRTAPSGRGPERREQLKGYFAAVTAMDANVGRVLDRLEALRLRDDTLVFFLSDNGMNMGHHGVWGKGNGTFPFNMYDTSVKIPAILSQPGTLPVGAVSDAMLSQYDFLPTLLDYLGLPDAEADRRPGRSFAPLLRGQPLAGHESIVVCDEYGPVRMVRTRDWKYVHRYPYGPHELYDLRNDPNEEANLADDPARREVRTSLKAHLDEWFERYVDPARDGVHEAVCGTGQLGLCGAAAKGQPAFLDEINWQDQELNDRRARGGRLGYF